MTAQEAQDKEAEIRLKANCEKCKDKECPLAGKVAA